MFEVLKLSIQMTQRDMEEMTERSVHQEDQKGKGIQEEALACFAIL
jgi:hypothetical protein